MDLESDPFENAERVQISVSLVNGMDDDDPDEVLNVVIDGLSARVGGADLANIAQPPQTEYRVPYRMTRETRVHSWGASGVMEFVEMHVSGTLTDAAVLAALRTVVRKYADRKRNRQPLTLESAKEEAMWAVMRRDDALARSALSVESEEERDGGVFTFEILSTAWRFVVTVEGVEGLASITSLKRVRRGTSGA